MTHTHRQAICEECGETKKVGSTIVYFRRILCKRCYQKLTSFAGHKRIEKEWKAQRKRKALSPQETKILFFQWHKMGLSKKEIQNRIDTLRFTVLNANKKALDEQKASKPSFTEVFTELTHRRTK